VVWLILAAQVAAARGNEFARAQLDSARSMQLRDGSVPKYPGGGGGGAGVGTVMTPVGFERAERCPARLEAVTTTRSR
jgi:hypothetical protein